MVDRNTTPKLTDAQRKGLQDFWDVMMRHEKELERELIAVAERIPVMKAII